MNAPRWLRAFGKSVLLALGRAQQCLAAQQRERGNLVQLLKKLTQVPPIDLVPPLTKPQKAFISDIPIGFQIGN